MASSVDGTDPWAIPAYLTADQAAGEKPAGGVSPEDARYLLGGIMATSAPLKAFNGIIPEGGNDQGDPTGLLLTKSSGLQVLVQPGRYVSQRSTDSSPYLGGIKSPALLDVEPGDAYHDRIDLVVGDPCPEDPPSKVYVVTGEAKDNPTEPDLPHDGCVKLGTIPMPTGASSVGSVLPWRVFTSAVGGVRLVWNDQGLDEPGYPGQLRNHDGSIDQWDKVTNQWSVIIGRRLDFTPVLRNNVNTAFNLGSGAGIEAWYQFLQKDVCHVSIMVTFGSGVSALRNQVSFDPPPRAAPAASPAGTSALGQLAASLYVPGYGSRPRLIFQGFADARPEGFYPFFSKDGGKTDMDALRSLDPTGNPGSGTPVIPNSSTLFNGVTLSVHGAYRVPTGAASG